MLVKHHILNLGDGSDPFAAIFRRPTAMEDDLLRCAVVDNDVPIVIDVPCGFQSDVNIRILASEILEFDLV